VWDKNDEPAGIVILGNAEPDEKEVSLSRMGAIGGDGRTSSMIGAAIGILITIFGTASTVGLIVDSQILSKQSRISLSRSGELVMKYVLVTHTIDRMMNDEPKNLKQTSSISD
jgi:hypothetical protein